MALKQIPNLTPVVFLSPSAQLEIVQDGTSYRASAGQIGAMGGFSIKNDITSTTTFYPIYAGQSSGTVDFAYASDPNYVYTPFDGILSSLRLESLQGIHLNRKDITKSYTIPVTDNGLSAGPVTVSASTVITVPPGSRWVVV